MMNERKRARTSFHYICLSFISFVIHYITNNSPKGRKCNSMVKAQGNKDVTVWKKERWNDN